MSPIPEEPYHEERILPEERLFATVGKLPAAPAQAEVWPGPGTGGESIARYLERFYNGPATYQLSPAEDPLECIHIYTVAGPVAHWHFVTQGFAEATREVTQASPGEEPPCELTLRVRRGRTESEPPSWPLRLLQNLAKYVVSTGNPFDEGHYIDLGGPLVSHANTRLTAMAMIKDTELGETMTPVGLVTFLQVVALTADELAAIKGWDTLSFMEIIGRHNQQLLTDLTRTSYLRIPSIRTAVDEGQRAEGSATDFLFLANAYWLVRPGHAPEDRRAEVFLSANGINDLKTFLPTRISLGRSLSLVSRKASIRFEAGLSGQIVEEGTCLVIKLTPRDALALSERLRPKEGTYPVPGHANLALRVVRSEIRNDRGEIIDIVG
jgi:suppressor of fused-like protein